MTCGRKLTSQFNMLSSVCLFYGFQEKVIPNKSYTSIYVTGNLENQAFWRMPRHSGEGLTG